MWFQIWNQFWYESPSKNKSKTLDKLNIHLKSCSIVGDVEVCNDCGFKSGTIYGMSIHIKKAHNSAYKSNKLSRISELS